MIISEINIFLSFVIGRQLRHKISLYMIFYFKSITTKKNCICRSSVTQWNVWNANTYLVLHTACFTAEIWKPCISISFPQKIIIYLHFCEKLLYMTFKKPLIFSFLNLQEGGITFYFSFVFNLHYISCPWGFLHICTIGARV